MKSNKLTRHSSLSWPDIHLHRTACSRQQINRCVRRTDLHFFIYFRDHLPWGHRARHHAQIHLLHCMSFIFLFLSSQWADIPFWKSHAPHVRSIPTRGDTIIRSRFSSAPMPFLFYRICGRSSFALCTNLKVRVPQVGSGSGEGATGCGVIIELMEVVTIGFFPSWSQ